MPRRSGSIRKQPTRDSDTAWRSSDWDGIARRVTGSTRLHDSIPTARISRTRSRGCWLRRPTIACAMVSERRRSSSAWCRANKTIDLGETMAMALAERGQFAEAVAIQRQLMEASSRQGLDAVTKRMAANLLRYERGQPCRMPWTPDDPIHSPGPPVDPDLLSSAPTVGCAIVRIARLSGALLTLNRTLLFAE